MAWIDPSAVAQGEVLTSAKWNQDVVANTIALRVPPMCRLTRSTNQEISNSTVTVVGYDTVDIDTDATMGTTGAGGKNNHQHRRRISGGLYDPVGKHQHGRLSAGMGDDRGFRSLRREHRVPGRQPQRGMVSHGNRHPVAVCR